MRSLNKVMLIGHLGKDVELKQAGMSQVAELSVATSESWKEKTTGESGWQERTEWHRVVTWGKQAEFCAKYLRKGAMVYVEGQLQTRKWTDKEGVVRYSTDISAQVVNSLSPLPKDENVAGDKPAFDQDVPF